MAVTAARGEPAPAFRLRRILAGFALPELSLLLFYAANAVALACVCAVRPAPRERFHLGLVVAFGVLYAVLARSLRTRPRNEHLRRTLRRFVSLCALFGIYFQLRWIIPAVHPGDLDAQLHEIDVALLGAPAAELLAPYQPRFWVEWFAFFYWTYFYVIGAYILGHLFLQRDGRRFATFGWGIAAIHIVGWSAYFLVPGFGPYEYLKHSGLGPLDGGTFLRMCGTATTWGPMRDIFPSLHTAIMTYLTLHAVRHFRDHRLYRIIVGPLAFWALQIVIATVYLRWHYVIDVICGLLLAVAMHALSPGVTRRWGEFRTAHGAPDPWW